jgi:ribosome biogenesis GTPase A
MNPRIIRMVKRSHIVLEVIDIRRPKETRSKMLENFLMRNQKPFIRVFNKADLVPKKFADTVVSEMGGVYISSKKRQDFKRLRDKIREIMGGRKKAVISVIGYPNTGKSSLINGLKGKKSAGVASVPGFTKGEQLIRMDENIMLIDTPGAITSETEEELAAKGAIAPEKVKNPEGAAEILLKKILENNKGLIKSFYKVPETNPRKVMEDICIRRGWKSEGDAARKVLQDWNSGKLKGFWY